MIPFLTRLRLWFYSDFTTVKAEQLVQQNGNRRHNLEKLNLLRISPGILNDPSGEKVVKVLKERGSRGGTLLHILSCCSTLLNFLFILLSHWMIVEIELRILALSFFFHMPVEGKGRMRRI